MKPIDLSNYIRTYIMTGEVLKYNLVIMQVFSERK